MTTYNCSTTSLPKNSGCTLQYNCSTNIIVADKNLTSQVALLSSQVWNNPAAASVAQKTDVTAAQTAINSHTDAAIATIAASVWGYTTRTVSSLGTLVADVWAYTTRDLSVASPTLAQIEASTVLAKQAQVLAIPTTPLLAINYTAPNNSGIASIVGKLPSGNIAGAGSTVTNLDQIPAAPTSSVIATAVDNLTGASIRTAVSGLPALVWGYTTRTVSSLGTLVADIWSNPTRTLTTTADSPSIASLATTAQLATAVSTTNANTNNAVSAIPTIEQIRQVANNAALISAQ